MKKRFNAFYAQLTGVPKINKTYFFKMNLYKVKHQRSNQLDEWIEYNYVVASSYAEIEKKHPNAIGIILVKNKIEILN